MVHLEWFDPRCGTCGFKICDGEEMTAVTSERGRQSDPFIFKPNIRHKDKKLNVEFEARAASNPPLSQVPHHTWCFIVDDRAFACHTQCLALAERFKIPIGPLLKSLRYSYEPSKDGLAERERHLLFAIQQALAKTYSDLPCPTLPPELWRIISKDVLVPYVITQASCMIPKNPAMITKAPLPIDLSESVWAAKFKKIDGVEYISALSNQSEPKSRLIWHAEESPIQGEIFYVLEDHLGVRQITKDLAVAQGSVYRDKSAWWHMVSSRQFLKGFEHDGIKLRMVRPPKTERLGNLGVPQTQNSPFWDTNNNEDWASHTSSSWKRSIDTVWQVPLSRDELQSLTFHTIHNSMHPRMIPLELNEPGIFGYTMCWRRELMHIYAHKHGEDPDVYQEFDALGDDFLWTYMPLHPGERIQEIWAKESTFLYGAAMALRTSKGRTLMAGQFPRAGLTNMTLFNRVARLSTECPSRGFFNVCDGPWTGVDLLAMPPRLSDAPLSPRPIMASLAPLPKFNSSFAEFHSSCSLENVAEVVLCRSKEQNPARVTGLLVRYTDGTEASVGSFRLDCTCPPLVARDSSDLFIGHGRRSDRWYIGDVKVSKPIDHTGLGWKRLPWTGTLEWWFTHDETIFTWAGMDV